MAKEFIDSIGLDGDGIINDLDFYQYSYGIQYFINKKLKKKSPINKKITNPYWFCPLTGYDESDNTSKDVILQVLSGYLAKYGIDMQSIIKNPNAYDIKDIFGCTKFERQIFWLKHFPRYCTEYPIRKDASYYINKWQQEGRKVHFITARAFVKNKIVGNWVRNAFENTLKENNINPDSITYCREKESPVDKEFACRKYKVKVMAEDKVENIKRLSKFIPVVSFKASYNEDCTGNNIIRTNNDFAGLDKFITDYENGYYPSVRIYER